MSACQQSYKDSGYRSTVALYGRFRVTKTYSVAEGPFLGYMGIGEDSIEGNIMKFQIELPPPYVTSEMVRVSSIRSPRTIRALNADEVSGTDHVGGIRILYWRRVTHKLMDVPEELKGVIFLGVVCAVLFSASSRLDVSFLHLLGYLSIWNLSYIIIETTALRRH